MECLKFQLCCDETNWTDILNHIYGVRTQKRAENIHHMIYVEMKKSPTASLQPQTVVQ